MNKVFTHFAQNTHLLSDSRSNKFNLPNFNLGKFLVVKIQMKSKSFFFCLFFLSLRIFKLLLSNKFFVYQLVVNHYFKSKLIYFTFFIS